MPSGALLPFLWHPLGYCPASPRAAFDACRSYNFWSGIEGDLTQFGLLGTLGVILRHHNCEQPRCLRLGHRHPDHGRPVCRRHYHDDVGPSR